MGKSFHMAVSVNGALERSYWRDMQHGMKALFDVKSIAEVRKILNKAKTEGLEVIPFESCDNHKPTGQCLGHDKEQS